VTRRRRIYNYIYFLSLYAHSQGGRDEIRVSDQLPDPQNITFAYQALALFDPLSLVHAVPARRLHVQHFDVSCFRVVPVQFDEHDRDSGHFPADLAILGVVHASISEFRYIALTIDEFAHSVMCFRQRKLEFGLWGHCRVIDRVNHRSDVAKVASLDLTLAKH
jgi:hypothetical protein